jgi:hypothetical protein
MMLHVVKAFQGESNVNTPMHAWDLQALNNAVLAILWSSFFGTDFKIVHHLWEAQSSQQLQ